jgi:hypothetical protein
MTGYAPMARSIDTPRLPMLEKSRRDRHSVPE